MEDHIIRIWNESQGRNYNTIISKIMKEAREHGYPLGQVMRLVNQLRLGEVDTVITKPISALQGCQTDMVGNVVDPYTLEGIPEEFLISYKEGEVRHCFDIRSVAKAVHQGNDTNPLTRNPFPDEVLEEVEGYINKTKKELKVGNLVIEVFQANVFHVLVAVLSSQGLLESLQRINPFYEADSLYEQDLSSEFIIGDSDRIELYPFIDGVEQALAHKKLFEYCVKNNEGVANTLFYELGFLLRIPPTFLDEEGYQFMLDPDDTIYSTITKLYLHMGGYSVAKRYNLVLDDGTPLYELDYDKKVVEVIPSLEVKYVSYHDEDDWQEAKNKLHDYNFINDNKEFIRELAAFPDNTLLNSNMESVINDCNYTIDELIECFIRRLDEDLSSLEWAVQSTTMKEEVVRRFVRTTVLHFITDRKRFKECVRTLLEFGINVNGYVSWREMDDDIALLYLKLIGSPVATEIKIKTLVTGGKLPINQLTQDLLFAIDDVEFFLRHYNGDVDFLGQFLYDNTRIGEYILDNEDPLKLFMAMTEHAQIPAYALTIMSNLSDKDLASILSMFQEGVLVIPYDNQFVQYLPQSILNDEGYYPELIRLFLVNPDFTNYKQALLTVINLPDYEEERQVLVHRIGLQGMVDMYDGSPELLHLILENFDDALQYKDELKVKPDLNNFEFFTKNYSYIDYFFEISDMTKEQVLEILCHHYYDQAISKTRRYFDYTKEDAQRLLVCNDHYLIQLMQTGLIILEDVEAYLGQSNW